MDSFDGSLNFKNVVPGEYAYLGPVGDHFGHMMAECVHRVVPSKILAPGRKFIMIGSTGDAANVYEGQPQFIKDVLRFLDLAAEDVVFLNQNAIIDDLFICEQGSDFGGGPKGGYLEHLDAYTRSRFLSSVPSIPAHDKVYVSRSKLPSGGGVLGESYIESLLENEGFFVFHPQEHKFLDQLHVYAAARVLIFAEGAACHAVELLGNRALNQCYVVERRPDHRDIFRKILQPRAQYFSSLVGSFPVASIVLHPETGMALPNLAVVVLNHTKLAADLRKDEIATLSGFSRPSYHEAVRNDFAKYVSYHKKAGSRMVDDGDIIFMEQHMNRMLHVL